MFGDLTDPLKGRARLADPVAFLFHLGLLFAKGADTLVGVGLDGFDQGSDVAGRGGGTLREFADFLGDDREPPAVLTGPDRLDRGVQGEHVGPAGDPADQLDYGADLDGAV